VIAGFPIREISGAGANVELAGYVPDTRTLYHASGTVVVAPLFSGTGQRVKLLEAFSMACPVITTPVGATGFPIENGVQALLAETAGQFETALRRLLADPGLRAGMGRNAREMILDRFTWSRIGREFLDVVEEAVASN
jgi:glycosyltransferase involved in cell wall biosynthesis